MNRNLYSNVTMLTSIALARSIQKLIDDDVLVFRGQNFAINLEIGKWAVQFVEEHPDKLEANSEVFQKAIDDFAMECVVGASNHQAASKCAGRWN